MPELSPTRIAELLEPYVTAADLFPGASAEVQVAEWERVLAALGSYLDLLVRWNARTNLTAIRDPEEIIQRHFGESLFAAIHLANRMKPEGSLLDFGSGAGFPGLPIHIALPGLQVVLAESQGKKASFLREAVRTLGLTTEVWAARVEDMPSGRLFDVVTMRAVDRMATAVSAAQGRVQPGGVLAVLAGTELPEGGASAELGQWGVSRTAMPGSARSELNLFQKPLAAEPRLVGNHSNVPRGTLIKP
jgi:16S rRNA (guanine527-N7)-methyltransferase